MHALLFQPDLSCACIVSSLPKLKADKAALDPCQVIICSEERALYGSDTPGSIASWPRCVTSIGEQNEDQQPC